MKQITREGVKFPTFHHILVFPPCPDSGDVGDVRRRKPLVSSMWLCFPFSLLWRCSVISRPLAWLRGCTSWKAGYTDLEGDRAQGRAAVTVPAVPVTV